MRIDAIPVGANPPDDINVIIEVPLGGEPIKYEIDKASGALFVVTDLWSERPYMIGVVGLGAVAGAHVEAFKQVAGARFVTSSMFFLREDKYFANTDGTTSNQTIYRAQPNMNITAVAADGSDFQSRESTDIAPRALGYEHVRDADRLEDRTDWLLRLMEDRLMAPPLARGDHVARQGHDPRDPVARHPRQVRIMPRTRDFH